MDSVDES
jgi:class 3 adenylate cyclase